MPGLTVDTSPRAHDSRADSPNSPSHSRTASPVRPPYSPITPTLGAAGLATASNGPRDVAHSAPPRPTYTHSQPHQIAIPQPPPIPITLDSNPDALALKSAISILQLQARNAIKDIQSLQRIKERALEDPEEFARVVATGDLKGKSDSLFAPSQFDAEDEAEAEAEDDEEEMNEETQDTKRWPKLPAPQNVVRCPPINWNQYAVVGESLDKLHADQQARPSEGMPQRLGSDGQLSYGGDSQRRQADLGIAAPFQPGRDRIDKMGTRKGGKR